MYKININKLGVSLGIPQVFPLGYLQTADFCLRTGPTLHAAAGAPKSNSKVAMLSEPLKRTPKICIS